MEKESWRGVVGEDCWSRNSEGGMKEVGLTSWGSDYGEEIVQDDS